MTRKIKGEKYKKNEKNKKYKKQHIPKALREQCWVQNFGQKFKHKCYIKWCKNTINVFDYHVGHNIPESQGGKLCLENLKPICSRCNHSMGSQYTITEWMTLDENMKQTKCCWSKKKYCKYCGDIKKNHKKNCPKYSNHK